MKKKEKEKKKRKKKKEKREKKKRTKQLYKMLRLCDSSEECLTKCVLNVFKDFFFKSILLF